MTTATSIGLDHPKAVGPYRIREVLGEGGMATVYLADQLEPVKRTVALKMIKLGMDTRQLVARFESERQALAVLEHPSIAKVYDAGASETGRPYFAMEWVHGIPITAFCDREHLSVKERIELLLEVCGAVQHAHQKGLIHRDLKPSNILVGKQDGSTVTKVIDFGIAKAIDVRLVDDSIETKLGQLVGTPDYMSPEQAGLSGTDVDTRTDIYSLGVILYELLTGLLPLDLDNSSAFAISQTIREKEPLRPSRRVTLDGQEREWICEARNTDRISLKRELRGDLDWITMKALAKQREQRYATVAEFSADLKNYLDHRPVLARPPSRSYVVGRFIGRNRLAVIAAATSITALIVGTVLATLGLVRALNAEQAARTQAQTADQRTEQAESLLGFMVGDLRDRLEGLGRLDLLEDIGKQAMAYFVAVDVDTLTDSELVQQAQVLTQLGEIRIKQLKYGEAVASFSEAYERSVLLCNKDPHNGDKLFNRGQAEFWLGYSYWFRGSLDDAEVWLTRYRDTSLELTDLDKTNEKWVRELAYAYHNLAALAQDRGDLTTAEEEFKYTQQVLEGIQETNDSGNLRNEISDTISWLGNIAVARGDMQGALDYFRRSEELSRSVWRQDSRNAVSQQYLVWALLRLAKVNSMMGNFDVSVEDAESSVALSQELLNRDPSNTNLILDLSKARLTKGSSLAASGDWPGAGEQADLTITDLEKLLRRAADDSDIRQSYAAAELLKAWIAQQHNETKTALQFSQDATETMEHSMEANRRLNDEAMHTLASSYIAQAELYAVLANEVEAKRLLRMAGNLLRDRAEESSSPYLLEPWARWLYLTGQAAEGAAVRNELEAGGFQPLKEWPSHPL